MDKQIIEEMAKLIKPIIVSSYVVDRGNDEVKQNAINEVKKQQTRNATALYNAGYRKADDLLKELQSMKSDFAKDMLEIKETYEKEVVDLVNEVRKETAEKFALKLADYFVENCAGKLCLSLTLQQWYKMIDEICKGITEGK